MEVENLNIPGLALITPRRIGDARGWFSETWNTRTIRDAGLDMPDFVQDNHSFSELHHTLRGLHYQRQPHAQAKLVRCTRGAILDVAVDVRAGSPLFGKWVTVVISAEAGSHLFVPVGFLHGFLTLTDECEVQYKCSDYYDPDCDGAVRWDSVGIDWGTTAPVVSDKDAIAVPFSEFETPFCFEG